MNILERLPEDPALFSPVATSFQADLPPDVISAANGVDGMEADFAAAAAAVASEQLPGDTFWTDPDLFTVADLAPISDAVDASALAANVAVTQGDAGIARIAALDPPANVVAAPPPTPTPAPPGGGGGGGGTTPGGGGGGEQFCLTDSGEPAPIGSPICSTF